ncbi:MAG: secretin N-terminal domain-containing protein, partial [Marinicellaceae bacterium]
MMKPIYKLILVTLLLTNICQAQSEDELFSLNLKDADIRLLIETVSDITKKNFVVDPDIQGKITVISGHEVPKDEIYNIFLSILSVKGLAAVKDGNSIKIVPENQAGGIVGEFSVTHDSDFVTRIIPIKYVAAAEIKTLLSGINKSAKIIEHKDSNLLIISDRAKNVERMIGIINRIDKKSDSSIEMVSLKHANAQEVAQTVESLLDTGSTTLGEKTKIVADERTNSVIVNASPSLKMRVMALIAQLDEPLATNSQSQVVKLKYSKAESLVDILQNLANKSQSSSDGEATSTDSKTSIQAHKETNSLVINASPTVLNNLLSAIEQLDIKRPQILVEAIIAELTIDHSKEA